MITKRHNQLSTLVFATGAVSVGHAETRDLIRRADSGVGMTVTMAWVGARGKVKLGQSVVSVLVLWGGGGREGRPREASGNAATTLAESNNCWTLCSCGLYTTHVNTRAVKLMH